MKRLASEMSTPMGIDIYPTIDMFQIHPAARTFRLHPVDPLRKELFRPFPSLPVFLPQLLLGSHVLRIVASSFGGEVH